MNKVTLGAIAASSMFAATPAFAQCSSDKASACDSKKDWNATAQVVSHEETGNIVEVAAAAGSFETLIAAAKAAGLVDALTSDGPLTVLAPSDEAFSKLPAGTVESLLKPENKDKLIAVLTYHVVPGKVMSGDVSPGKVATVQGQQVTLAAAGKGLKIDNANIVATDIETSNGVIHVIDTVILPN